MSHPDQFCNTPGNPHFQGVLSQLLQKLLRRGLLHGGLCWADLATLPACATLTTGPVSALSLGFATVEKKPARQRDAACGLTVNSRFATPANMACK